MASGSDNLLEIRNASKTYGPTTVLSNVSFTLKAGETVAVIGQNGAGKSTFSKIVAGVIEPDQGAKIVMNGEEVILFPPRNALKHGVAFIPQELAYVPELTVAENILLGRWPKKSGFVSHKEIIRKTKEEAKRFGIEIDVEKKMSELKLADKQLVEILKALSKDAKILLLDEPTASLTENESNNLFKMVGTLAKEKGVGVVYISHRMDEVFRYSDRIDVFRNGKFVASEQTKMSDHQTLIFHMLGQQKEELETTQFMDEQDVNHVFSVNKWNWEGLPKLKDINFSVSKGEIVGIFGVRGCGAEVIAEGIVGLRPDIKGEIEIEGNKRKLIKTPIEAKSKKIAYVPPDRKKQGLVLGMSIKKNISLLILNVLSKFGIVNFQKENEVSGSLSKRFNVRTVGLWQNVGELSGGNQQKVLLSSRLAMNPKILVLQEPTRGVDIGARLEIHRRLREIAADGTATLLVTSDLEEAIIVCDRLIIMRDGKLVGELKGERKTEEEALRLAAGD
ncbi:sugar ABC transporter ATP-binding protein [Fredinandcohnia onubensis]|uniref:sugar ABC transporter ATP-binding protein n=1 Tax=Fredinandcohnia onubensis TaxID=1571209 RepID=UPI000C0C0D9A|nr:sugar ABC transporter ATP-binding protein [Fredinandcohnia onubensis]